MFWELDAAAGRPSRKSWNYPATFSHAVTLSKKIPVLNSPWGRDYERPSDCQRWIGQGHAKLTDAGLLFTGQFFTSVRRVMIESDPVRFDDGIVRRWVKATSGASTPSLAARDGVLICSLHGPDCSCRGTHSEKCKCGGGLIVVSPGGIPVKQLLPVKHVGIDQHVSKRRDKLVRRQPHTSKPACDSEGRTV